MLAHWAQSSPKPVILFLDEVDALVGNTLISLLRQIRSGYAQRPEAFPQTIVLWIELKILRGNMEKTIQTDLDQTADYADRAGADEAHLLIFNRDRNVSWDEKIFRRQETHQGRSMTVWGA